MLIALSCTWAHALTTDEVIKLKKAGVSDETIRTMIEQEKAAAERNPSDRMGVQGGQGCRGKRVGQLFNRCPLGPHARRLGAGKG